MTAPLTVIIPTLDAAADLPAAAAALMPGVQGGLIRELIVSDGGSSDETPLIAAGLGAVLVTGPPGRGAQMRRGAEAARGEWLLFLHADTELSARWSAEVQAHIARYPGQAGYFRLRFGAPGAAPRFVAGWANLRARLFGLPYGDQGVLVSRAVLAAAGGVPDLPLMEDVALARALAGRLRMLDAEATTSPRRYQDQGWLRRGARNLTLQARYFLGADPARLAERYRRR